MANWLKHCCTPLYAEIIAPRVGAICIAAAGAAQLGASCFGFGMPCSFHSITGLPCPGCGLTRSVLALLQGHVKDSLLLHPFGPVLLCGLGLALLAAVLPGRLQRRFVGAVAAVERQTGVTMWVLTLLLVLWGVRITGVLPLAAV